MSGVRRPQAPRRPRPVRVPKGAYGRSYKKWMSSEPNITVERTTTGALGTRDLRAAAEVIADGARRIAGEWSARIPPSIRVEVSGSTATISSDAPPAYPNEIEGVRHPVFARGPDRREWHWVTNQYRPFLTRAADEQAGPAMARYAEKFDRMLRAAGFE